MKILVPIVFAALLLAFGGCTNTPVKGLAGGSNNMYESDTPRP